MESKITKPEPNSENSCNIKDKSKNTHPLNKQNVKDNKPKEKGYKRIQREFFLQEVVELSKALLGKVFVRKTKDGEMRFKIVETEAYKAPLDKACHAYNNKKTDKTKYFWQIGGCLYVFTIYGHNCINITAASAEEPEAVLIRAIEPIFNIDLVKSIRKCKSFKELCNGPGKAGESLCLDRTFNGVDLCKSDDIYLIEFDKEEKFEIGNSKRVNIDYAEEWIDKMWRFYIKGNPCVSRVPKKK